MSSAGSAAPGGTGEHAAIPGGASNLRYGNAASAIRAARAAVRSALPDFGPPGEPGLPLEIALSRIEPPRVVAATVVEDSVLRARRVEGDPVEGFAAFLDGTQRSEPFDHVCGAPLVLGTVAAVVRERRFRRMVTWRGGPRVDRRVFAPRGILGESLWGELASLGLNPADTTAGTTEPEHPHAVALRARELVQNDREALERGLAEQWIEHETRPLFVDGGLRGSEVVAKSPNAAGIVKSHRTLYAAGAGLNVIFALRAGWRTSVFRVDTGRRAPVLSWYLRLRDAGGRDPFFGLVRVEIGATDDLARADEVSRWILAEVSPLALPDARWHNLVYPIRDCEEFLAAIG